MLHTKFFAGASLALLSAAPALAQSAFADLDQSWSGTISAGSGARDQPLVPGGEAVVTGEGLEPGQTVTLMRGETVLNEEPYIADGEGAFEAALPLPEDAVPGIHPILAQIGAPSYGLAFEMKISPDLPLSGEERFIIESAPLVSGLYQVAYSAASDTLFVASAVGRPPIEESQLLKVDPETLEITASITPETAPENGVFAVYGIGVDDAQGTVWVTNTRQDTVAVYDQDDLSLIKQFAPGTVGHARDVVIDAEAGRAYASATFEPTVHVFDTETLEELEPITIPSSRRRATFGMGSIALDPGAGRLVAASLDTDEVAVIDTADGSVLNIVPLENVLGTIGIAYDPEADAVIATSQGSDHVTRIDAESGEILSQLRTGAGPLNAAWNPASGEVFVTNRVSGTLSVLDAAGEITATLPIGTFPNGVIALEDGTVFVVNKSAGEDDAQGDHITRITPAE
ncbi:YncE family protein [Pseudoroseicyclus aestuarii]|uniref:YVTN family beta-propeller protein n=1 Tax=Pseudoroseicyclus aestuarii TaxID=1795041 RepID=A0A318SVW2_9RHOB|nr:ATP-binding protein [Pseudoroseicyclus aestuarii]PYE84486.1 YVTN family beta-propeller protein [Pseudoroseicyclus aestuarii]